MTLSQALLPSTSLPTRIAMILAGSLFIALSAQASVPMFPVPMTLQTLAISIVGLAFGARLAAATLIAYLVEGAMGLPVFADGKAGAMALIGPTGGYLWGFVAMAWMTGWMVERGFDRGLFRLFIAALIPAALLFVPGVAMLQVVTGMSVGKAIVLGATPFLLGGVVKAALAALVVAGGWSVLRKRG